MKLGDVSNAIAVVWTRPRTDAVKCETELGGDDVVKHLRDVCRLQPVVDFRIIIEDGLALVGEMGNVANCIEDFGDSDERLDVPPVRFYRR